MLNVNVSRYGSITKQATTNGATAYVNSLQQVSDLTLAISILASMCQEMKEFDKDVKQ